MSSDEQLIAALGRVTSGLYILTLGQGDQASGLLVSWVMQAGFEPPMLTLALKRGRLADERLTATEPFVLNVIGADQTDLLKHFGKGFEPGEPAFEGLQTTTTDSGVTALSEAIARLECLPEGHLDSGDHRVFLARVTAGALPSDAPPMTHLRKRGDRY